MEAKKKTRQIYKGAVTSPTTGFISPNLTDDDRAMVARLKAFRQKYIGKTLQEATDNTGVPTSTISSMELGRTRPTLPLIQAYKDKYGLNMEWAATGKGADRVEDKAPNTPTSMQILVDKINTFQTTVDNMNFRVDGLIRENAALKKRIAGLEEDMRHLNRIK